MTDVAPEPVFRVASGFMAAKHLLVANEVGLFEQLADGPATLDELDRDSGRAGVGQAARDHPLRVGGREERRLGVAAWRRLAARLRGCWLAGIGFTMSLFISDLAFDDDRLVDAAKLGILVASLIAGVVGWTILSRASPPR